jgi:hypothetical protein
MAMLLVAAIVLLTSQTGPSNKSKSPAETDPHLKQLKHLAWLAQAKLRHARNRALQNVTVTKHYLPKKPPPLEIGTTLVSLAREVSSRFADKTLCMACPLALDFESSRVVDWVAYHSLIGVDCFVLLMDMSHARATKSASAARADLNSLSASVLLRPYRNGDLRRHLIDLPHAIRVMGLPAPTYYAYIDVDEYIVLDAAAATAAGLKLEGSGRKWLPAYLDAALAAGPSHTTHLAVNLQRFSYGTSGLAQPVHDGRPEFAVLTRRQAAREQADTRLQIYSSVWMGKLIQRLGDKHGESTRLLVNCGVEKCAIETDQKQYSWPRCCRRDYEGRVLDLRNMHTYFDLPRGFDVLLPNGTALPQPGESHEVSAKEPKKQATFGNISTKSAVPRIRTVQPLSINHYASGTYEDCVRKASGTSFHGHKRTEDECLRYNSTGFNSVGDAVLVAYAEEVTRWRHKHHVCRSRPCGEKSGNSLVQRFRKYF